MRKSSDIQSSWLIRVLASSPDSHRCENCGARMFVKAASGMCPVCFTRQRNLENDIEDVVQGESLAAVQDWSPSDNSEASASPKGAESEAPLPPISHS